MDRKKCITDGCNGFRICKGRCRNCDAAVNPEKYRLRKKRRHGVCSCGCGKSGYLFGEDFLSACYQRERKKNGFVPQRKSITDGSIFDDYFKPILLDNDCLICEETGESMPNANSKFAPVKVSWVAHILPKRYSGFPSLSMDRNNSIILSGMFSENQAHAFYDASWSNVRKMKVLPKVLSYIHSVIDGLPMDEQRRARKILEILEK